MDDHEIYDNPEHQLIASMLKQAVNDLWLHPHNVDSSLGFFLNEEYCFGSFLWCCDILGVESGAILKNIRTRIAECVNIINHAPKKRRKRLVTSKLLTMMSEGKLGDKR